VSELAVVSVLQDRLDDLQPVWRALYEHHTALMPQLRDREVPFEQAWQSRREIERGWFESEPDSFVLAAQDAGGYVGYAFVRVRPGASVGAAWRASDPLAELAILVVLPEVRGQGVGSMLLDAAEAKLGKMGIEDMIIGVITTNTDAMRLYERRGAVPIFTQFIHRVHPRRD
jgi:GNAT superfamily N-acetyltransferase